MSGGDPICSFKENTEIYLIELKTLFLVLYASFHAENLHFYSFLNGKSYDISLNLCINV